MDKPDGGSKYDMESVDDTSILDSKTKAWKCWLQPEKHQLTKYNTARSLVHLTNSDGCELLQKPLWSTYPLDWTVSLKLSFDFVLRCLVTLREMELPPQHGETSRKEPSCTYRSIQMRESTTQLALVSEQINHMSVWPAFENSRQVPLNSNRSHDTYNACDKQSLIGITFHIRVIGRIIWWHTKQALLKSMRIFEN